MIHIKKKGISEIIRKPGRAGYKIGAIRTRVLRNSDFTHFALLRYERNIPSERFLRRYG